MEVNFGEYIEMLRTESELNLTQLGLKSRIDSGALNKIETGKKHLSKITLPNMIKYSILKWKL